MLRKHTNCLKNDLVNQISYLFMKNTDTKLISGEKLPRFAEMK